MKFRLFLRIVFPRLCAYYNDASQYYPCAINYIGINNWSLYRCPDGSIFDEPSQQCLMKFPISESFDQLAMLSSSDNSQFKKIASFFVPKPYPNREQQTGVMGPFPINEQVRNLYE